MVKSSISLQKMQAVGYLYLVVAAIGAWLFFSWNMAWSVVAGGLIAMVSFFLSSRDVQSLIGSLSSLDTGSGKPVKKGFGKGGYLLKFWIRLAIIGVVLLLLIKGTPVNIFGLIIGLSTIVFTVAFTALNVVKHYYFSGGR